MTASAPTRKWESPSALLGAPWGPQRLSSGVAPLRLVAGSLGPGRCAVAVVRLSDSGCDGATRNLQARLACWRRGV